MRRLVVVPALVLLAPLALGACGSPGRTTPSDKALPAHAERSKPTVFPARTPSATPVQSPTAGESPTSAPSPTGGGGGNTVQAGADNKFAPEKLTVPAGTEVSWTAVGFHTVTGGKDGKADPASPMNGPAGFQTYKVKFDKPGSYPYFCQPHYSLGMIGEIVVT